MELAEADFMYVMLGMLCLLCCVSMFVSNLKTDHKHIDNRKHSLSPQGSPLAELEREADPENLIFDKIVQANQQRRMLPRHAQQLLPKRCTFRRRDRRRRRTLVRRRWICSRRRRIRCPGRSTNRI